jgi:hypothetical protein
MYQQGDKIRRFFARAEAREVALGSHRHQKLSRRRSFIRCWSRAATGDRKRQYAAATKRRIDRECLVKS